MKNKTIKTHIDELDQIIDWFDSEDFELEEAMAKFEEAKKLADQIEEKLNSLKNEITIAKKKFDFNA